MSTIASNWLNAKLEPFIKNDDKQEIGFGGFVAGVRVRENITRTQTVTSNTVEDGSFINDHIIETPLVLNIEGQVGDIERSSTLLNEFIKRQIANIGVVSKYLPSRTVTQLSNIGNVISTANDTLNKIDDVLADSQTIYNLLKPSEVESTQESFLTFVETLFETKTVIAIDMPFRTYSNMVITSIVIERDNTTNNALSYKITAQQMRFAKVIFTDSNRFFKNPSSGLAGATSSKIKKGIIDPVSVDKSLLSTLFGG